MITRIKDLINALDQFLLGALPITEGIYKDLETNGVKFTRKECFELVKTLNEIREKQTKLGIQLSEIFYIINRNTPNDVEVKKDKPKKEYTAQDLFEMMKTMSVEDVKKIIGS